MDLYRYILAWINYLLVFVNRDQESQLDKTIKPNVIVIMADDMGWNDVSYHGSNEIPTPNLDALAYSGVILNRHYVLPTCTPSRASFFTGRHAIRTGLQGLPINAAEPRGLPLREKILPQYLKELGYATHMVGKWHLGYYTERHLPTRRGFDTFAGFYNGYVKYFDHTISRRTNTGVDFHLDTPEKIEPYQNDRYITDFITERAEDIIRGHDNNKPLYLHVSHAAAHASENIEPMEVRDMTAVNETLGYIPDLNRRKYAGIVTAMDESIGKIVKALGEANMLNNSVVIFMSDNGAPTSLENYPNYGSNYPLRGMKTTVYEGGIRVPAFIFSPLLLNRSRVSSDYVHAIDWLPTIYRLAGGSSSSLVDIDGIDQWHRIKGAEVDTRRDSLLVNIDEVIGPEAAIIGNHKLVRGIKQYYGYYGESGRDYSPKVYDFKSVESSDAARAIEKSLNYTLPAEEKIKKLRTESTLRCTKRESNSNCSKDCLFDIIKDPCETTDLSVQRPEILVILNSFIDSYRAVLKPQTNDLSDPAGFPKNFHGYWMPWLDVEHTPAKDRNVTAIWSPDNYCEGYAYDDPRNCLGSFLITSIDK